MEEYLTSFREVETRLQSLVPETSSCLPGDRPTIGGDVRDQVRAMCGLNGSSVSV